MCILQPVPRKRAWTYLSGCRGKGLIGEIARYWYLNSKSFNKRSGRRIESQILPDKREPEKNCTALPDAYRFVGAMSKGLCEVLFLPLNRIIRRRNHYIWWTDGNVCGNQKSAGKTRLVKLKDQTLIQSWPLNQVYNEKGPVRIKSANSKNNCSITYRFHINYWQLMSVSLFNGMIIFRYSA